ncbi:hypothetical protein, partial [Sphingobacterium detergens]|uniref:hypothetical protein n=1 Tax=Sphingobacterium detergens TaxID=1145106 RepID=UPI001ABFC0BE
NRWESRSVPFFTRKPLLETVKGFFRLHTSQKVPEGQWCRSYGGTLIFTTYRRNYVLFLAWPGLLGRLRLIVVAQFVLLPWGVVLRSDAIVNPVL